MRLLLTSSGWGNNSKIKSEFLKLTKKKYSDTLIFLINTAEVGSSDWKYVEEHFMELVKIGFSRKNIKTLDSNKKLDKSFLKNVDIVYVCGGNTFQYLNKIRKTGADRRIKKMVNRGASYFGISAGSILAGSSIDIAQICDGDENKFRIRNFSGLKLTDVIVHPHYQEEDEKEVRIFEKVNKKKVIRLKDNQALLIKDKDIDIIS